MKKIALILFILLSTNFAVADDLLKIQNVKQGLISNKSITSYVVDDFGNEFTYRPNGSCIQAGKRHNKCMWWGIAFSHKALTIKYDLPCKVSLLNNSNSKTYRVDPEQYYSDDKDVHNISLPIEPNVTETSFPFYATKDPEDNGIISITYECSDTNVKGFKTTMVILLNEEI